MSAPDICGGAVPSPWAYRQAWRTALARRERWRRCRPVCRAGRRERIPVSWRSYNPSFVAELDHGTGHRRLMRGGLGPGLEGHQDVLLLQVRPQPLLVE